MNSINKKYEKFAPGKIKLLPGILKKRSELNRKYMMSLDNERLLQNFYLEAGIRIPEIEQGQVHQGWEAPVSQLRGHFLGHWLSAASKLYASQQDFEIKAKAEYIVSELGRCQERNGGEWVGSIPEKYLYWVAEGKKMWAPQYTIHKTLMGLWDMYEFAGSQKAFEILNNFSKWFHRWTGSYSKEQMKNILDMETGGMIEIWANLYGVTKKPEHLELMNRYYRSSLFDRLLAGEDALTNEHANTTIPEIIGAARAWEVTGEKRWKDIVEAYWHFATDYRGCYCTGGQTSGEMWTPPQKLSARLGKKNQEHCTVYNMMRLADILLSWTGNSVFADYWERNLYNGILAQQNPETAMVAYYLPLCAGGIKKWGTATEDFWCCHGTMVQAHSEHGSNAFLKDGENLVINQYIPSSVEYSINGSRIKAVQNIDYRIKNSDRPESLDIDIEIYSDAPSEFSVKLRIPWWTEGDICIFVNDKKEEKEIIRSGYFELRRVWENDRIRLSFPRKLYTCPMPDDENMIAFMDGPVVLAGICSEQRLLTGDKDNPYSMMVPDDERDAYVWLRGYRAKGQDFGLRFIPLYEVCDERYQVYFEVKDNER